MTDVLTGDTVELLQHLIRNQCVNDGSDASGHEVRSADLLRTYLEGAGLEVESFEPIPGRTSLVTRIEGTDPSAPSLCLMGHTDVVPVSPEGWRRDPFGGELVDGEVWGRGAVDMLNLTASMAVVTRHLARTGFRPRGTLIYLAVADEEAGGGHGAEWLLDHVPDAVMADWVVTEGGGLNWPRHDGLSVSVAVAEKGVMWRRLRVRGTPGHGSAPYGTDNALVKAAEVVRRLAAYRPAARVDDLWRGWVDVLDVDAELRAALLDPARLYDALGRLPDPGTARLAHACSHTTFSPNVAHGGVKTNVIPDIVDLDVDIRVLPGETAEDVSRHLAEALGDLAGSVEVTPLQRDTATASPTRTPLYDALQRAARRAHTDATLLPSLMVGGTDARFYRRKGSVAYGFALFSRKVSWADFRSRFHGHDERVDVESLALTTKLWADLVPDLLG